MAQPDLWYAVHGHRARLLRIAIPRTQSIDEAEDCVQEAMLRCVEFDGLDTDRIGAFLTTTTMRLCADEHRERHRQVQIGRRVAVRRVADAAPEEAVCERAEADWMARQLDQLPAGQRAVLRARSEGLPLAEVAVRCGVSFKSAESAISRARATLRALLATTLGWLGLLARRRNAAACPAACLSVTLLAAATVMIAGPPGAPARGEAPVRGATAVRVVAERPVVPPAGRAVPTARPAARLPTTTQRPARPPVLDAGPVKVRRDRPPYSPVDAVEHCYGYGLDTESVAGRLPSLVLPDTTRVSVCAHVEPPGS